MHTVHRKRTKNIYIYSIIHKLANCIDIIFAEYIKSTVIHFQQKFSIFNFVMIACGNKLSTESC